MSIYNIDFETRSHAELKDVGLDNYSKHPSTEVICMAYSKDGGEVKLWTPDTAIPNFMFAPDTQFSAWNASFERHIIKHVLGIEVKWDQFIDSMAMAAANNIPQSLEEAAIFLGLSEQKDPVGKRLITKLSKPQKSGTFNKDPELLEQMYRYCIQDVKTEMAVHNRLRKLSPTEQQVWVITQVVNERGIPVAVDELKNAIAAVDAAKSAIDAEIKELTGGISANQPAKLIQWVADNFGVYMEDMTGESVAKMLLWKDLPSTARRVLELREAGSSTSVAKFEKMFEIQNGGRIRNLLVYHGASTGRWASRGGLNVQNLPRPQIKDEAVFEAIGRVLERGEGGSIAELSSIVRSVLKAPEGYTFLDVDFSSIENRVGVFIAGQKDKLDMFAKGLDEYKTFASEALYNIPYDEVTKDMRQISKSAVLGCMFGQGSKGLVQYAQGMGVKMDLGQAEQAVEKYRSSYFKVKNTWYELEQLAIEATQTPGVAVGMHNGRVVFKVLNDALWMRLPSGRLICWQSPEVGMQMTPWGKPKLGVTVRSQNTYTRKWGRNSLIGSSIFQSAVQATARDLLAESMMRLEENAYEVVGCVHDEVILLTKDQDTELKLQNVIGIMTSVPDWASGLPVAAEGWISRRYQK
jgi:DNA polymerase